MGRPRKTPATERQLVEFFATQSRRLGGFRRPVGRPSIMAQATWWAINQFDPRRIKSALEGKETPGDPVDKGWGVTQIIRSYCEIANSKEKDAKGKPVVNAAAKLRANVALREYQELCAVGFELFAGVDRQLPDQKPRAYDPMDDPDPGS